MKSIVIFLLLWIPVCVSAQVKTITGRVVNSATQEGIGYASIGIEGSSYGTVCDVNGFFELKIPQNLIDHKIAVSVIGFQAEKYVARQLANQEFARISLQAHVYMVGIVSVEAQSKVLFRIIRTAAENIPVNYATGPFAAQFHYLEQYSTEGSVIQDREGIVELFDKSGYRTPSITDAFMSRGYLFTQVRKNFQSWSFPLGSTGFDELLEMDVVRLANTILNPGILVDYNLSLEQTIPYEGDSVLVISYSITKPSVAHSGDYHATDMVGKLYVLKSSHIIIRNECTINAEQNNWQNRSLFSNKNFQRNVNYKYVTTYQKVGNAYVLNYIECDKTYNNEKGEKINYFRKAHTLSLKPSNNGNTKRNYFEDVAYAESFWNSFDASL